MSIQSEIDGELYSEDFKNSSIMIKNASGDATIPDYASVRLYDCQIGTLIVGKGVTLHIRGGQAEDIVIDVDGQFIIEDCSPIEQISISGSRGIIKKTDVEVKITKEFMIDNFSKVEVSEVIHESPRILDIEDSQVFFYRCEAIVPPIGIKGVASTIKISECNFIQETDHVVWGEKKSYIQITDSHIEGTTYCPAVTVIEGSTAIITTGDGTHIADKVLKSGIHVIKAAQGSYVRVRDTTITGSDWHDYGIICEENSVVECTGDGVVYLEGGKLPAIEAKDNSSVTIANYDHVTSIDEEAIKCWDNSRVRIFQLTDKIQSDNMDAIWIRNHSRVEVYDVPEIFAPVGDAVDMSEYCKFIGVNISNRMEGVKDYGILATVYCEAKIDRVANCVGDGEDGVFLEDHCRLTAMNGQKILGKGDNGVEAVLFSHVTIRDYSEEVVGLATDGIHLEDGSTATVLRAEKIRGVGKDGIYMINDCYCHTRECTEVKGEGRDGVHGEVDCEYTSVRDTKIEGVRDGIHMTSGRFINVRRTEEVRGLGRDGIHADNTNIDVFHVPILHGDGDKCIYVDTCVGTFESIPDGHGGQYGLYAENSSDIRIFRSKIAGANPLSLYMNNSCRLFAKDVEFAIKDAKTQEHCETNLENVTIFGKFESKIDCKHEWLRVRIMDKVDFDEAIYRWKEVTIVGDHLCKKSIGKVENTEVGGNFIDDNSENHFSDYTLAGNITHIDCTTKLKGSEIQGMIGLTTCTLRGENTTVNQITDFATSTVEYDACTVANIDGKSGSSYFQRSTESAEIKLDASAGHMEGGNTGPLTLTDSDFEFRAAEVATATLTSSALVQRGGTLGSVSGSDSTFEHHQGTCGAVSITSGSIEQHGGILGAVSITNGGFYNQGGTCAAISATSSHAAVKGGIAAAVVVTNGSVVNDGGTTAVITATNSGVKVHGGTSGAISLSSSGLIQQGGTVGAVSLGPGAFTGKGGTYGSVSGSGAVELISMTGGSISVGHLSIPACVPGMVARCGTDKLYEVFDNHVRRWFNADHEERVTGDRHINIEGDSFKRITGSHELDVKEDISLVAGGTFDIHATDDMSLITSGDLKEDATGEIGIISGPGQDITIESGFNFEVNANEDIILTAMVNFEAHCNAMLHLYANLEAMTSAPVVIEMTPAWTWPGSSSIPALPVTPGSPDTPEDPDDTIEPIP